MYTRTKEFIKSKNTEPNIFVEGDDFSNSELLYKLDKVTEFEEFIITKNEHRIDLISEEIYGDDKFSWILMYINRISIDELVRGVTLRFIPRDNLLAIINNI